MILPKCTLLIGLILTLLLDPISGKKGGHSYPRSGGLSGGGSRSGGLSGGSHGYPSSGGSHAYPSSGTQSHAYPSGGSQSHAYPSSGTQSHAYPSGGSQSHAYPSSGTQSHGYPSGSSQSHGGSHSYPSNNNHGYPSGGGLSGNGHGYSSNNKPAVHHTTNVVNNYHYAPPAQISYATRGGPPVSYPVYHGTPPTYVYQYKDSGSKYGTLLAGLALMNLGTLGVSAYALHKANQNQNHGSGGYNGDSYTPVKGEVCKFGVKKDNGDYEETRIDCQIISGFILQDMQAQNINPVSNSAITTTTVTNVTIVNTTNVLADQSTTTAAPAPTVLYMMLANGTLVPVNATLPQGVNVTHTEMAAAQPNNTGTSTVITTTTTTTNTTQLASALDVKGKPVDVTPGMQCFLIRQSSIHSMKKTVPCGVLQTYADKSIQRNAAAHNMPMFTLVAAVIAYCVA